MTPPLPLAELVKTWEERSRKCYADGEYTAEYHIDRCIDELRALPLGRCETCREWQPIASAPNGVMVLCADMHAVEAQHWAFVGWRHSSSHDGCVKTPDREQRPATHWMPLPAPPAAGEETRDGK